MRWLTWLRGVPARASGPIVAGVAVVEAEVGTCRRRRKDQRQAREMQRRAIPACPARLALIGRMARDGTGLKRARG
jgi:hypothetical protein